GLFEVVVNFGDKFRSTIRLRAGRRVEELLAVGFEAQLAVRPGEGFGWNRGAPAGDAGEVADGHHDVQQAAGSGISDEVLDTPDALVAIVPHFGPAKRGAIGVENVLPRRGNGRAERGHCGEELEPTLWIHNPTVNAAASTCCCRWPAAGCRRW